MSVMNVLIERTPEQVWALLEDGHSYAEWVVGTQKIHEVDEHWPAVGSVIKFSAGIGPIKIEDTTIVRRVEPKSELELEARARWLGSARVSFDLRAWGENTLVIVDEHPLTGPGARWHNAAIDAVLHMRNRRMVRALADAVEQRFPG